MTESGSRSQSMGSALWTALKPSALMRATFALFVCLVVVVPVAHALRFGASHTRILTLFAIALVAVSPRLALADRRAQQVILAALAAFVLLQIVVASNHVTEPYSDFRTQWQTAIAFARDGIGIADRPQTQRAIPFFVPLIRLFGTSASVYVTANVVLACITYAMATWVARRFFGGSGAAKTALVLLFAGELYVANTIPSHDVLGTFGLVAVVFVLAELNARLPISGRQWRAWAVAVGFGVVLGLLTVWTEWQRSTSLFCLVVVVVDAVAAVLRRAPALRHRWVVVAVTLVTTVILLGQLRQRSLIATLPAEHVSSTPMNLLAFTSADGDGRLRDKRRAQSYVVPFGPGVITHLSDVMFSETLRTSAGDKYKNFLKRSLSLLRFGAESNLVLSAQNTAVGYP